MAEIPVQLSEWALQLDVTPFYQRKGDVFEGAQFEVYTKPDLPFVIKIPKDPMWMNGYRLVQEKAPDLVVPFSIEKNIRLNINRLKTLVPEAIIQEKVVTVTNALAVARDNEDWESYEELARQMGKTDHLLFKKGIYGPDPNSDNMGLTKDGLVKYIDAGSLRESSPYPLNYSVVAHSRAFTHLDTVLFLNESGKGNKGHGEEFGGIYAKELGIQLPNFPHVEKLSDLRIRRFHPDTALLLMCMGDDEFRQYAPNGSEFDLETNLVDQLRDIGAI